MLLRTTDHGTTVDEALRNEVATFKLDDTVNERPHANLQRISEHARRATFRWVASTCHIKQNQEVVETSARAASANVQQLWFRYKDALPGKAGKVKRSASEHFLFSLRHLADGDPSLGGVCCLSRRWDSSWQASSPWIFG